MRDRMQLELTVAQYHDAMREERRRHLAALLGILRRSHDEDWYVWVLARKHGIHRHDLKRADGKSPAACPVRGCPIIETPVRLGVLEAVA